MHKVPYRCAKFERNRSTGRVFLVGSVTFVKRCEEEEEGEENGAVFRNTYLANYWTNFFQIWYVGLHIWKA